MKLLPFVMPAFPDIQTSWLVLDFLAEQPDVIVETALPSAKTEGSAFVLQVRQAALKNGVNSNKIFSTFLAFGREKSMLMLHETPNVQQLEKIGASFKYAIAPFAAEKVAQLNAPAKTAQNESHTAHPTFFGAQVTPEDADFEAKIQASQGFIYLKAAAEREGQLFEKQKIADAIRKIKAMKRIDVFCGFGVKTAGDIRMLKDAGADGVFLGAQSLKKQQEGTEIFKHAFDKWRQTAVA